MNISTMPVMISTKPVRASGGGKTKGWDGRSSVGRLTACPPEITMGPGGSTAVFFITQWTFFIEI